MFALVFAFLHLLISIDPVVKNSSGEKLAILLIDFPLTVIAQSFFPKLFYGSITFRIILFSVLGTIMYGAIGYYVGKLITIFKK